MPFSPKQVRTREASIAAKEAATAAAQERDATLAEEQRKTARMLAVRFPGIPQDDADSLWSIATSLTDQLIYQYEAGDAVLEASSDEWESLFGKWSYVTIDDFTRHELVDKGYLAVLQEMAHSYNDIGQSFTVRRLRKFETRGPSSNPRVRITCTAPLPD